MTNEYYSTYDLALVTTISLYHPIDSIDKDNPRKSIFVFKRSKKLDELIEAYYGRELKIEPQEYFNQLKTIKSRLYSDN